MKIRQIQFVFIFLCYLFTSCKQIQNDNSNRDVFLKKAENGSWSLYCNNKPFYIKGGHGATQLELLKQIGGNSILVYDNELSDSLLNKADSLGLRVAVTIDIGKIRFEDIDYKDKEFITRQRDSIRKTVKQFADHPALLIWNIGNEAHIGKRNAIAMWKEVNDISKMIHSIDPNHPTTSVIASFPTKSYQPLQIKIFAPDLDFISITVFEFARRIKREYDNFIWGFDTPFLVTEWSGTPYWMNEHTDWDAIIQPSSTKNAAEYYKNYPLIFDDNKENCIGGFVFYWGQKQERTHTVFSLLLENKYKTQAIENIQYRWTEEWPEDWCPRIDSFYMEGGSFNKCYMEKDSAYTAILEAFDPDKDSLSLKWEILREGFYYGKTGGEAEEIPEILASSDSIVPYLKRIKFVTPDEIGPFRLFVYVYDNHDYVATANIPFYVFK